MRVRAFVRIAGNGQGTYAEVAEAVGAAAEPNGYLDVEGAAATF